MKQEIRDLWTTALRSGEYTQSHGVLKEIKEDGTVGYCCLGVLTDLAVKAGVIYEANIEGYDCALYVKQANPTHQEKELGETATLPDEVCEWAGLGEASGQLRDDVIDEDDRVYTSLIGLNDGAGFTFAQIADVIDAQF